MTDSAFLIDTHLVRLAVELAHDGVRRIWLHGTATRAPTTAAEQALAREVGEYFAGTRTCFSTKVSPAGTSFERRVWDALVAIPYGETRSYGDIARAIGQPGAARAVGMANHRNPIPIIIPCHRVIATGGSLGGFGGGVELKRNLLELEDAIHPSMI